MRTFIFLIISWAISISLSAIEQKDSLALVDFYNSTRGHKWINNTNWLSDKPVYKWQGVIIRNNRVVKLILPGNNLYGEIPETFGNLQHLQTINLKDNKLRGEVPSAIKEFSRLNILLLENNRFSFADIQSLIGIRVKFFTYAPQDRKYTVMKKASEFIMDADCPSCKYKWFINDAEQAEKTGKFETKTAGIVYCIISNPNFPDLTVESELIGNKVRMVQGVHEDDFNALSDLFSSTGGTGWINNTNWLTKQLVEYWYGVTAYHGRVVQINLPVNELRGNIPSSIDKLSKLRILNLSSNALKGVIPENISKLRLLEKLNLNQNKLNGTIPNGISALQNLKELTLKINLLSGTIPENIGSIVNLELIDFSDNQLKGELPSSLYKLHNLKGLYLNKNELEGSLSTQINQLKQLINLNLTDNLFTNQIPMQIGELKKLEVLALSINDFSGTIPESIYNLSNLEVLGLSANSMTGEISQNINKLRKIRIINIEENQLSGKIAETIGQLSKLEVLMLSHNKFNGSIPFSLMNLEKLSVLYLHNNQLSGSIPPLFIKPELKSIKLQENLYTFSDLINIVKSNNLFIEYTPQKRSIEINTSEVGNINILNCQQTEQYIYHWYKNGKKISSNETGILELDKKETGRFQCRIQHKEFKKLELITKNLTL